MLFNNEKAVSPIVATLVLVVVAIAGAAAVGTIMGSFSSDVSDSASAAEASSASSTELLIGGSTTVQPVSEGLVDLYTKDHPGVKVTVQGGGSGAGIAGAEMGVLDIGSASKDVDTVLEHPDLQKFQIGGSAVVVIVNDDTTLATVNNTTQANLDLLYLNANDGKVNVAVDASGTLNYSSTGTAVAIFQRDEASGTEETFAKYLPSYESAKDLDESEAAGKVGNSGVLAAVEDTKDSIGFVDYGFAAGNDAVKMIGVECYDDDVTEDNIVAALKGEDSPYPADLTRPLNYLTNGAPSTIEQSFINFALSPAAAPAFEDAGYFQMLDLA